MLRYLVILAAMLVGLAIQTSVITVFSSGSVMADIALVVVVLWTVLFGFNEKWARILIFGAIYDLVAYSIFGSHLLSFVICSFSISFLTRRFLSIDPVWKFAIMVLFFFMATYLNSVIILAVDHLKLISQGQAGASFSRIWSADMLASAAFNIAAAFILYHPVIRFESFLDRLGAVSSLNKSVRKKCLRDI